MAKPGWQWSALDGRVPALAVLGYMWHGIQDTQRFDELPSIISFITAHGNAMPAGKVPNHALCCVPLGGAGSPVRRGVMIRPWQFLISICLMKKLLFAFALRKAAPPGSVVEVWVWLSRRSP